MHIKDKIAEELYGYWDLEIKDKEDILQALAEAYMRGCMDGGLDSDLHNEAVIFFSNEIKD